MHTDLAAWKIIALGIMALVIIVLAVSAASFPPEQENKPNRRKK